MKQTNSTLKFLTAEYSAVLHNAYVKGLASTALLGTAIGAVGAVNTAVAAEITSFNDLANKGDVSFSQKKQQNIDINNADGKWEASLNVTDGSGYGITFNQKNQRLR